MAEIGRNEAFFRCTECLSQCRDDCEKGKATYSQTLPSLPPSLVPPPFPSSQVVLSFRYTSITSVLLLDGFAIPCTMLLSRLYLKSRFRLLHFVGVVACLAGLGIVVYSDYRVLHALDGKGEGGEEGSPTTSSFVSSSLLSSSSASTLSPPSSFLSSFLSSSSSTSSSSSSAVSFPHALKGDLLTLIGAALYACSNVLQELVLKTHNDPSEFLGMLGGLGALLAGIQALFIEWGREGGREGEEEEWGKGLVYILGFAVTLATMYTLTARFLREVSRRREGGREAGREWKMVLPLFPFADLPLF